MSNWPQHPVVRETNTWVWLSAVGRKIRHGRPEHRGSSAIGRHQKVCRGGSLARAGPIRPHVDGPSVNSRA